MKRSMQYVSVCHLALKDEEGDYAGNMKTKDRDGTSNLGMCTWLNTQQICIQL